MSGTPPQFIATDEITDYYSYLKSIDWWDPWLMGLIFAHTAITIISVVTRKHSSFQIVFFFLLLIVVYFSEYINEWAATNWQRFSRQQYFDSNGFFISTVFSIPILLNCMLMIGNWLYTSTQLMAKVKTAQLRQHLTRKTSAESDVIKKDS